MKKAARILISFVLTVILAMNSVVTALHGFENESKYKRENFTYPEKVVYQENEVAKTILLREPEIISQQNEAIHFALIKDSKDNEYYVYESNRYKLSFPKYIDKGEGITIEKDDTVIELIPKTGDFSRPVVKENAVLFNDVMDGVDVQYTLNQNGIEQSYIYRKYGSFETIPWKVEVKKAIASQRENQVLIHKMFQEDTIFTFSEATLFDSAGNSVALNTIFKHVFGGYQLTTNVDINWASEPQRAFPLRLKTNILAKENSLQGFKAIQNLADETDNADNDETLENQNISINLRPLIETDDRGRITFHGIFADGIAQENTQVVYQINDESIYSGQVDVSLEKMYPDSSAFDYEFPENTTKYKDHISNWQTDRPLTDLEENKLYYFIAQSVDGETMGEPVISDKFIIYRFKRTDDLPSVARYYGITIDQIIRDNQIENQLIAENSTLFLRNPQKNVGKENNQNPQTDLKRSSLLGDGQYCNFELDSVNVNTGNFYFKRTDVSIKDFGGEFAITRFYNSHRATINGLFGYGWTFRYEEKISRLENGSLLYYRGDGSIIPFTFDEKLGYIAPKGYYYILATNENGYVIIDREKNKSFFDKNGLLYRLETYNGYVTILNYDEEYRLTSIQSPSGLLYILSYGENDKVTNVLMPNGCSFKYEYDEQDNLVSVKNALNNETKYVYNDQHYLISSVDSNDEILFTNTYDEYARLLKQVDADQQEYIFTYHTNQTVFTNSYGEQTIYQFDHEYRTVKIIYANESFEQKGYDENNNLSFSIDQSEGKTEYRYDDFGNVVSVTRFDGEVQSYEYNDFNQIVKITDFDGKSTYFIYNDAGDLIKEISKDGAFTLYEYDNMHRIIKKTDANGNEYLYKYENAWLSEIIDPKGGRTQYFYNQHGQVVSIIGPTGDITRYSYDLAGRKIGEQTADGVYKQYAYNDKGLVDAIVDGKGNSTIFSYDSYGNINAVKDSAGGVTRYTYDSKGNKLTEIDPLGRTTKYEYDSMSNLTKIIEPNGKITQYQYNSKGYIVAIVDGNGNRTTFTYDDRFAMPKTLTTGDNLVTTFDYDSKGNVIKQTWPDGSYVSYTYDDMNRMSSRTDTAGLVTYYTYDKNGNLIQTKDSLDRIYTYTYDKANLPLTITDPEGGVTTMEYDAAGNMIAHIDPLGRKTEYKYNQAGKVTMKIDALGNKTIYNYDDNANLIEEIAPDGAVTKATYDVLNRISIITDPRGNQTKYTYDQSSNVVMVQNALGYETKYKYGDTSNPIEITDALGNTTQMGYDQNGNVLEVVAPDNSKTINVYDNLNRLIKMTDAAGLVTEYEYDVMNRLVCQKDNTGKKTIYEYDKAGRLVKMTNALGETTSYTYDLAGNILSSTTFDGNVTTYTYNKLGKVTSITDPEGKTTTYEYDKNGNLLSKVDEQQRKWKYMYDELGRLTKTINPLSETTQYSYDSVGRLISQINAKGNAKIYEYDIAGNQIAIQDENGNKTSFVYDPLNRVIKTIASDKGQQDIAYDALNRIVKQQDALSNITRYEYDIMGNITKQVLANGGTYLYEYDKHGVRTAVTDPLGNTIKTVVDLNGQVTKKTMPNGAQYTYQYDVLGRITAITAPDGMSKNFVYDENGNLAKEIDQSGREISYTYDKMHRLIDVINPNGGKQSYTYDSNGNVSSVVTPMGYRHSFEYDALDRVIKELDPVGKVTEYTYDVLGNIEKVIENGGRVTSYTYDNVGNITSITNPLNQITTMQYDSMNRMTKQVDAAGKALSYEYDYNGQLVAYTDKRGAITRYAYDSQGNLISKTDALNRTTSYTYDLLNRITGVKDANGVETRYVYDSVGNMISRIDGEGRATSYTYDLADRLTSITNPLQEVQRMQYDLNGNLSEFINPDGTKIEYDYDMLDALVSKKSSEDTTGLALYGYDKDGRRITMEDATGTTRYEYDEIGRITSVELSVGGKIGYIYDSYGNLIELSYPDGTAVHYEYDALDRLIGVIDRTNQKTSYIYDLSGNLTEVLRPNGTSTVMEYDEMDNIIKLENKKGKDVISSFEYTYDLSGTIIKEVAKQGKQKVTREYTYDRLGQITKIDETSGELTTTYTYTYDRVGNRLTEQEKRGNIVVKDIVNVFDRANRLVQSDNNANWYTRRTTYEYDKNGNLIKKNMPYDSYMTYKYDNENRLTAIRDKQSLLFAALYDGNGDRIFTVTTKYNTGGWHDDTNNGGWQENSPTNNYGNSSPTNEKIDISSDYTVNYNQKLIDDTIFIPNGINQWGKEQYELTGYINNVNLQYSQVLMEYGSNGKISSSFDYGLDRNSIISNGKKNFYAYDGRGSVSELFNSQGDVSMGYSYGAFGKTDTTTIHYVDNPYQYNAEYVDAIPGVPDLQYLRARYYFPYEGRFFTQDTVFGDILTPLSQNQYVYCFNNPMMFFDPSGRIPLSIAMAGQAAIDSYNQGMAKYDPCKQAQKAVAQKKQEAQIANQVVNNALYQPVVQPTTSSNNVSLDLGQAEAQRQAEEARKQQEKKKRDLYNKACTDLLNGQRYAQELAAIYQKEQNDYVYYIAQFPSIDWLTEDERILYQYSDFLQPFTESQKINLIVIGRERSITMDDIRRLYIDESLINQGIMDFFNTSLRANRLGLSMADLDQQFNSYAKAQRSQLLDFFGMAAAMAWVASYNASGLSYSNVSESQFTRFNFNETNSKYNIEGTSSTVPNKVDDLAKNIKDWLGKDAKVITNKSGDKVFISSDGTRRIRFDINNTSPHNNPHGHVEEIINGNWVKSGPLYPVDVPHN